MMFVRSSKKKAAGDLRAPESTLVSSFNWKKFVHLSRGIFVHLSRGIFKYTPRETFSYVEGF